MLYVDSANFMSAHHEECFGNLTALHMYLDPLVNPLINQNFFCPTDKLEAFPSKMLVRVLLLWNLCHRVFYSCDVMSVSLPSQ